MIFGIIHIVCMGSFTHDIDISKISWGNVCFHKKNLSGCFGVSGDHEQALQWRHNECDGVSNHRRLHGLLNRLFRRRSKKTSKFRVTGLCEGNSMVAGVYLSQRASNAENVSIWWRHHERQCPWFSRCWFLFHVCYQTSSIFWRE